MPWRSRRHDGFQTVSHKVLGLHEHYAGLRAAEPAGIQKPLSPLHRSLGHNQGGGGRTDVAFPAPGLVPAHDRASQPVVFPRVLEVRVSLGNSQRSLPFQESIPTLPTKLLTLSLPICKMTSILNYELQ